MAYTSSDPISASVDAQGTVLVKVPGRGDHSGHDHVLWGDKNRFDSDRDRLSTISKSSILIPFRSFLAGCGLWPIQLPWVLRSTVIVQALTSVFLRTCSSIINRGPTVAPCFLNKTGKYSSMQLPADLDYSRCASELLCYSARAFPMAVGVPVSRFVSGATGVIVVKAASVSH